MKSQWRNQNNLKFSWEWNKNTSKWLSFILRLKTNSKLIWLKSSFKNFLECLLKWTSSLTSKSKKNKMNWVVLRVKKFSAEFKPLRKSNLFILFKLLWRCIQCWPIQFHCDVMGYQINRQGGKAIGRVQKEGRRKIKKSQWWGDSLRKSLKEWLDKVCFMGPSVDSYCRNISQSIPHGMISRNFAFASLIFFLRILISLSVLTFYEIFLGYIPGPKVSNNAFNIESDK